MSLTQDKRTIEIYYETNDFVKNLNEKSFFDADFSISENISVLSALVRLPEGTALVESNIPNRLSFDQNATTISDGRRIIILWSLTNLQKSNELRFQVLYEKVTQLSFLSAWPYIVSGIVVIAVVIFFVFRYIKRPDKLVLSVLDKYERKVVEIIAAAGGEINQKKIVQETNLSKAKVSRVIKSLVGRGVVELERLGRSNKVKLLKKFKI
jgi:predicted transcriptional regulator